jgi:hypothetical protein
MTLVGAVEGARDEKEENDESRWWWWRWSVSRLAEEP